MKFIDWFAGIGGFRRGMELAGHECVGFCEFDKFATASYISMHLLTNEQRRALQELPLKKRQKEILKDEYRNGEWYANDVRRVCADDIPKADCWCFGFPCQDISVAGKQLGFQGNRSSLFFRVMYLIGHLRSRGYTEVFPVERSNREDSIQIIGHRDGYRRNTQVFSQEGITEALDTSCNQGIFVQVSEELTVYAVWYEKYQCYIAIRKLTPKECFRLQGWTDDYFEKAQFVNSDSQLYKQAGNGVTVNVIKAIAERMETNG